VRVLSPLPVTTVEILTVAASEVKVVAVVTAPPLATGAVSEEFAAS